MHKEANTLTNALHHEASICAIIVSKSKDVDADLIANKADLPYHKVEDLGYAMGLRGLAYILPHGLSDDAQHAFKAKLQHAIGEQGDVAILRTSVRKLVLCDMDSTIIQQECLDELASFIGKKSEISAITERAMNGELNFESALKERVKMLDGLDKDALQSCFETRISLNPGAEVFIRTQRKLGSHCILVSGGFTYFTKRVADICGFDGNFGNTLLEKNGKLTGEVGTPILGREAKAERLHAECISLNINPDEALAIGDGANDLAMISEAGLGIAYYAKPLVQFQANAAIRHTNLLAALFFQGIPTSEWVTPNS